MRMHRERLDSVERRRGGPKTPRRRPAAVMIGVGVLSGSALVPAATAVASPASTLACTDNPITLLDFTEYGTDIQMRASGNCGRTVWFRLTGWDLHGSGDVQLQVRQGSAGTIVNGPSQISSNDGYISPYVTGYSQARLIFTNLAGSEPNYTSAWYEVPILAR